MRRGSLARSATSALLVWAALLAPEARAGSTDPIRVGELNSYKAQPAFLEAYRKGWQLALEQVNAAGGVLGRRLEIVSRDDDGTPGDAVRVAEELVAGEQVQLLFGTYLSNVGLAVSDFARQRHVPFLAAEPLTDKITWAQGNHYTFRLRPSTYMQAAMLVPEAAGEHRRRWALVYPNYEYGQSAAATFKTLLKAAQPDVEFVAEQAPPLGRIDAGAVAQALADSHPDAIFNATFGTDLAKLVREGETRGLFHDRLVVSLLSGEPEYLEPLRDEAPVGWLVTGYPWYAIDTPAHNAFVAAYRARWNEPPRLGSVVGFTSVLAVAGALQRAGSTEAERVVEGFSGLELASPFGPIHFRAADHQSTLGAYVGRLVRVDGRGQMQAARYVDGASVLPSEAEAARLRPAN